MEILSRVTKRNDNSQFRRGGVAHRLEQDAHNVLVVGSTPTAPTTYRPHWTPELFWRLLI